MILDVLTGIVVMSLENVKMNHPPGVLRGVRPLLCPWTQNFVDCFLFCCALESSCLGRLSAIKVPLELELELKSCDNEEF